VRRGRCVVLQSFLGEESSAICVMLCCFDSGKLGGFFFITFSSSLLLYDSNAVSFVSPPLVLYLYFIDFVEEDYLYFLVLFLVSFYFPA
jgi:hypothetical protein